jgi:hypothetical protein
MRTVGAFAWYAVWCLIGWWVILLYVPETTIVNNQLSGAREVRIDLIDYSFRPSNYQCRLNSYLTGLDTDLEVKDWLDCWQLCQRRKARRWSSLIRSSISPQESTWRTAWISLNGFLGTTSNEKSTYRTRNRFSWGQIRKSCGGTPLRCHLVRTYGAYLVLHV